MAESFSFTQRRIEGAPTPEAGRIEYVDTAQPKLRLRVTATGHKSFAVLHKAAGKTRRITLGTWPAMTVDSARREAARVLGEYVSGRDPIEAQRRARAESATLGQLLERYLDGRPLRPSTKDDYRRRLAMGFSDWLDRPLSGVSEDMVLRRHKELSARGPTLCNGAFRVLRTLARFAVAVGAVQSDPVGVLGRARLWHPNRRRSRIIPSDHLGHFVRTVETLPIRDRTFLLLMLYTGLRVGEALRLTWPDVDLEAKTLIARETKSRRDHHLPIPDAARPYLEALHAEAGPHPFLFPGATVRGQPPRPWARTVPIVKAAIEASGVVFSPHDLRRTFATIAEAVGLPTTIIKRLLNHATDRETTTGYIRTERDTLRTAINRIGAFIEAKARGGEVVYLTELRG